MAHSSWDWSLRSTVVRGEAPRWQLRPQKHIPRGTAAVASESCVLLSTTPAVLSPRSRAGTVLSCPPGAALLGILGELCEARGLAGTVATWGCGRAAPVPADDDEAAVAMAGGFGGALASAAARAAAGHAASASAVLSTPGHRPPVRLWCSGSHKVTTTNLPQESFAWKLGWKLLEWHRHYVAFRGGPPFRGQRRLQPQAT